MTMLAFVSIRFRTYDAITSGSTPMSGIKYGMGCGVGVGAASEAINLPEGGVHRPQEGCTNVPVQTIRARRFGCWPARAVAKREGEREVAGGRMMGRRGTQVEGQFANIAVCALDTGLCA